MKKKLIFRGVATALITPFSKEGIDFAALDRLVDAQIAAGIDAIVVGGTTGEAATLTDKERYELYERVTDRAAGKTKIILGVGTNDTRVAVAHAKTASMLHPDGVLAVTPYYNKGTESGILDHYRYIAEASGAPVILYNVPSRTGVNLSLSQIETLAEHENIVAIKETVDSVDRLVALSALSDRLTLYAGNDAALYPTLALGGAGGISVISNVLPRETLAVTDLWFEGRHAESRAAAKKLLPVMKSLFLETNPTPVKYAASLFGFGSDAVRLPLGIATDKTRAELDRTLAPYLPKNTDP